MLYMGYNGREAHSGASVWIDFSDYTKNLTDYNTWCYGVVVKVYDYWGYDVDDSYLYLNMYNATNVLVQASRIMFEAWTTYSGGGCFKPQVFTNNGWETIGEMKYSNTTETKFWINTNI